MCNSGDNIARRARFFTAKQMDRDDGTGAIITSTELQPPRRSVNEIQRTSSMGDFDE